ncbi:uncharacterized protein LOC114470376 isoform X2 [Gouania willdenowi]|uniref:uncharacterized protein LOC114470376 isoform X2 n=1 Tax=Gouania willdenowi TaxID=441366 RepID=UPI0010549CDA|nr:uncharacterized protein LOC114470376 isoform X2 [Gouania willdenowi]
MNPLKVFPDLPMMRKPERAHFFSQREQELIMKLYEEERAILTAKSNTTNASRLREEAWQRIASKINAVSDSGYRRSWQQVKVKYKNIVQTARRRQAELMRNEGGSATPSMTSADDDILLHRDSLKLDALAGLPSLDQISGSDSSYMSMPGHPVLLMPVTKTEPESLSSDDTDISDHHFENESMPISHFEERPSTAEATGGGSSGETQTEDVKALYSSYLRKEMENRDQEMAYRALKMKKLEKEILLLDKQLM